MAPKTKAQPQQPQRSARAPQQMITSLPQSSRNIAANPTAILQKMDLVNLSNKLEYSFFLLAGSIERCPWPKSCRIEKIRQRKRKERS